MQPPLPRFARVLSAIRIPNDAAVHHSIPNMCRQLLESNECSCSISNINEMDIRIATFKIRGKRMESAQARLPHFDLSSPLPALVIFNGLINNARGPRQNELQSDRTFTNGNDYHD